MEGLVTISKLGHSGMARKKEKKLVNNGKMMMGMMNSLCTKVHTSSVEKSVCLSLIWKETCYMLKQKTSFKGSIITGADLIVKPLSDCTIDIKENIADGKWCRY